MPYPDFLCIGAQKSGTTWLYSQLEKHPDIWVPVVKELHYFDSPKRHRLIYNVFSRELKGKFVRSRLKLILSKDHASWAFRFIFFKKDNQNYKTLFRPKPNQLSGEVTPAYAWLDTEVIERIYKLMPNLKLIYLLRYPVDRVWSQMNMYRRRLDSDREFTNDEILAIKETFLFKHTQYTDHIQRWTQHFDQSQFYIGFFDQIKEAPDELISDIFKFLEIDPNINSHELLENLKRPRNQGNHGSIPVELEYRLTKELMPEIKALHKRFDNAYTKKWLLRAEKVLSQR